MDARSHLALPLVALSCLVLACGEDPASEGNDDIGDGLATGTETGDDPPPETGDDSMDDDADDADDDTDESEPDCFTDNDCSGGVCIDEACCDLADACDDTCCEGAEVCLFDSCVTPGDPCTTADECEEDEYCETGLGEPGGGFGDPPPGGVCTQELPPSGACVEEPTICEGGPDDPEDCVDACEVVPELGDLDATIEWQWGNPLADAYPDFTDVWATPTVARLYDANCDGKIDDNDPPNIVFVSGDSNQTCCSCGGAELACKTGKLRVLDGSTGQELWSLDKAEDTSLGFAGLSVALGDIDGDEIVEIIAATGEGKIAIVSNEGVIKHLSADVVGPVGGSFGWGGGIAVADMDHDGFPEIAFGGGLFTTDNNTLTRLWLGAEGKGRDLSYMADLNGDGPMELVAGNTAYNMDGTHLWYRDDLPDGYTAVGDFDLDGTAEVVLVRGDVWVLDGATGDTVMGPVDIPLEDTRGGPPTVADFDGDGLPEIGIAGGTVYVVYKPNAGSLDVLWQHGTKDTSSAVTGSSVFDFEGDGRAEVVYSDECFLRVLDGLTGELRFSAPNTTFTATESLIVADVDGDKSAEIVRVSNSANWSCNVAPWTDGDPETGLEPWVPPSEDVGYYRGISVFGDVKSAWVGTRTVWNQHAYHVSNVCEPDDSACFEPTYYGEIPTFEIANWQVDWLNNFRQNVQDTGIFDAPDVTLNLDVECTTPLTIYVSVRNAGLAPLPSGIVADVVRVPDETYVGTVLTTQPLYPGQTEVLELQAGAQFMEMDEFVGRIIIDPDNPTFVECNEDNNESEPAMAFCGIG